MNVILFVLQSLINTVANIYLVRFAHKVARVAKSRSISRGRVRVYGDILDSTHELTSGMYVYIMGRPWLIKVILVFMAIHINSCVGMIIHQSIFRKRVGLFFLLVYVAKAICNAIYHAPPPEGRQNHYLIKNKRLHWSIKAQQETFFSGHTALCAISVCVSSGVMRLYFILGAIITILVIITLRVHYIIDILAGILVVHFFYKLIF